MEKTHHLQHLDSSLRHYIQSNNSQFKCVIPSVLMGKKKLNEFYSQMYSSALNRKLHLTSKEKPQTKNIPSKITNKQVDTDKILCEKSPEGPTLSKNIIKNPLKKERKSNSLFTQLNQNQQNLQLWEKKPKKQMFHKPLISNVGYNNGAKENKYSQTPSQASRQKRQPIKRIRISAKFDCNMKYNPFGQNNQKEDKQCKVVIKKQNSVKKIVKSQYYINHNSGSDNQIETCKYLQNNNKMATQQKGNQDGKKPLLIEKKQKKSNSVFMANQDNEIFLSIFQMLKKEGFNMKQDDLDKCENSRALQQDEISESQDQIQIQTVKKLTRQQKQENLRKERENRRRELHQNFLISVVEDKNKELERQQKYFGKIRVDRVSEEYEKEEFQKFKQEEEQKYIKKYRLKEKKLPQSDKVPINTEEITLFEEESWQRGRKRKLNQLFKQFVNNLSENQVKGYQDKKEEIKLEHCRKQQLMKNIQLYFFRKNRYNPIC